MTPDGALRRVESIVNLLTIDIKNALTICANFKSANDASLRVLDRTTPHAESYKIVATSMLIALALGLARILDVSEGKKSGPVEWQDKASIPVLAALLSLPVMSEALINRAKGWFPGDPELGEGDCRNALDSAANMSGLLKTEPLSSANARLREFRTRRLAHHLFDKQPDVYPKVDDLFLLMDFVAEFGRYAETAIFGRLQDYEGVKRVAYEQGSNFWTLAFEASVSQTK